jgi:hypothetical protein
MKSLRDNSLTIVLLLVTLACITGMVAAGLHVENKELTSHGHGAIGVGSYLLSGAFNSALFENWESEFLQMGAYVTLTAILFQRGSAESRDPDAPERDGDELPESWRSKHRVFRWIYAHSLGLALLALFVASFALHWSGSLRAANEEALLHGEPMQSALSYLTDAQFWFESLQNWQSEFLSTAVLVVLSIFLRYKNSPESKPVSAPHSDTGGG